MSRRSIITLALGILSILAAACSAVGPRQIASYPADSNQGSPVYPPDPSQFVYNATLEMEVFDPVTAASRSKELAEFMIDAKIPRAWRARVPIVCSPEHILWVAGWRPDERVKVTEDTRKVLRLEFERVSNASNED